MDVFGLIFMKGSTPITSEAPLFTRISPAAVCDGLPFRQLHLMKVLEGEAAHLTRMNSTLSTAAG